MVRAPTGGRLALNLRRVMSNIELTDVDGDALTIYIRDESTWITCTSGAEEVTVGPFPTHVVRSVVDRGFEVEGGTLSALVRRTSQAGTRLTDEMRERAWEVFARESGLPGEADPAAREALDRALEAALAPPVRTSAAEALVGDLRRAAVTITDVEGLADHLVASGYRKGAAS